MADLSRGKTRFILALFTLLLLAAFGLRLINLGGIALRGDEAYTAVHWTKTPFSAAWMDLIEYEPNPGSLIVYWTWSTATGNSEFALRYLPLLASLLGMAVTAALAQRLSRNLTVALLVAVLWTIHPYLLWHAQDARQYSLLTLLTPLHFSLLLNALDKDRPRDWWFYGVAITVAVYIYYFEVFWLLAQGMVVLYRQNRHLMRRLITVWLAAAVALIPLAVQLYFVLFVRGYEGTGTEFNLAAFFSRFPVTLLWGENSVTAGIGLLGTVIFLGMLTRVPAAKLLLSWIVVPSLCLLVAATQTDLFNPRYIIGVVPAVLIGLAWVIVRGWNDSRRWSRWMAVLLLLGVVGVAAKESRDYLFNDPPKSPDWHSLVTALHAHTTRDDVIISGTIDPSLEYYYHGPARIIFIPESDPEPDDYIPQTTADAHAMYLITDARTGPVGRFLQANYQFIPGDIYPGVLQYRPWEVNVGEIEHPLDINLGDVARMRGYTMVGNSSIILYWQALATTEAEHSVMLHLERDGAPPVTLDHGIAGTLVSTRVWQPGALYRDPLALPADLLNVEYALRVGLYDYVTGEHLPVMPDDGSGGRVLIGALNTSPSGD